MTLGKRIVVKDGYLSCELSALLLTVEEYHTVFTMLLFQITVILLKPEQFTLSSEALFFCRCLTHFPVSILYKSIAGCYRSVSIADGPITDRYRLIKKAYWVMPSVP